MMDLQEAVASLDTYGSAIELHCKLYESAVNLAAAEQARKARANPATAAEDFIEETGKRVADMVNQTAANLERVRREALALSIVISEAGVIEIDRLQHQPGELAKLISAQSRTHVALQRAFSVLQEHEKQVAQLAEEARAASSGISRWRH